MKKRPLVVIIVSGLFIVVGLSGLANHLPELKAPHPLANHVGWVLLVSSLAVVGGVFMLLGHNWARWLSLAWMAFHVLVSSMHSVRETVIHSVLLLVIAYLLVRPEARAYFAGSNKAA